MHSGRGQVGALRAEEHREAAGELPARLSLVYDGERYWTEASAKFSRLAVMDRHHEVVRVCIFFVQVHNGLINRSPIFCRSLSRQSSSLLSSCFISLRCSALSVRNVCMYDRDGDSPFEGLDEVCRLSLPNPKTL